VPFEALAKDGMILPPAMRTHGQQPNFPPAAARRRF
jgi:hypothetical protein